MKRNSLDSYELMPAGKREYLSNYGWSFSKAACKYAVGLMRKANKQKVEMKSKEEVKEVLKKYGIELENNSGYDFVYVFHMALADFMGSSINDEAHLALFVKDVIDDADNEGGNVFRKWYCDMVAKGLPVDWEDIL